MTSCKNLPPPPKGWKCLDCWQCRFPPGTKQGTCSQVTSSGPDRFMTSCEASGAGVYTTKKQCLKKCGTPPINCYTCFIQPGQTKGQCILTHPVKTGTNKPVDKCSDSPNTFATMAECRKECTGTGPVVPVAKCWAIKNSETCDCTYGDAFGPLGPVQSCNPKQGFYKTQDSCIKACKEEKKPKDDTKLWIVIGVIVGAIALLLIIGLVLFFVWHHQKQSYEEL